MESRRKAAIEKMRAKMAKKLGSAQRDPDEFRASKVDSGSERDYYFYILPPISDEDVFFERNGYHYINNRYVQCPRIHETGDCPVCSMAFDLLDGVENKDERRAIAKRYLPQQKYAVNIMFTNDTVNGELAGKVMWYNTPQTVFKKLQDAFMRDDAGDDTRKPKAFGDFYNPDECYVFNLRITEKGGYNNYEQSGFLNDGPTVIENKEEVLGKRHDLSSKFPDPDMNVLHEFVDKALNGDVEDDDTPTRSATTTSAPKTEAPKTEAPKTEAPKTEAPKTEATVRTETVETPKTDISASEDPELDKLMADLQNGSI